MKRVIAFVTAVCLLMSGISAFAAPARKNEKPVELLAEMGILQGNTSGDLMPDKNLTRAEFVTMLTRILFEEQSKENKFSDTAGHWAVNNINLLADKSIVSGYENGMFGPDDNVTLAQAVKILINLLGYGKSDFEYPRDFILQAAKLSISKDVERKPDEAVSRNDAASLILNSLYVPFADGSGTMIQRIDKKMYYVSKDGSDENDGSYEKPWKTVEKAASEASGNAIVTLNEGVYSLNTGLSFENSGESSNEPLIFRAKHNADVKIVFESLDTPAITVAENTNYLTIENIDFSVGKSADSENPFLLIRGGSATIKNNTFENSGNTVLLQNTKNVLIEGNTITGGANAVVADGGSDITIKGNFIENQTESGITVHGNADGIKICNNNLTLSGDLENGGIVLGDSNAGVSKCAVWNNIIYAKQNTKTAGVLLDRVTDLCFYNNIVDHVDSCVKFGQENKNILLRNNIFMNSEKDALSYEKTPVSFDSNYNCFYGAYPQIMEKDSLFTNPYFVSEGDDWRLMNGSELAGSGKAMPAQFLCSDGSVMLLDNSDFSGKARTDSWHMGIYAALSGEDVVLPEGESQQEILLSLDFNRGADHFINSSLGQWKVTNGAYWQDEVVAGRTTSVYDGGFDWTNYEVSVDIESSNATEGNATGLIFRADKEMKNMYALRFLTSNSLEFVKWQNGSFSSIQRFNYIFKPDTVYNLKVKIENNEFTFYANGEQLGTVEDDTFSAGTVGFYCFREVNKYDNLKVVAID